VGLEFGTLSAIGLLVVMYVTYAQSVTAVFLDLLLEIGDSPGCCSFPSVLGISRFVQISTSSHPLSLSLSLLPFLLVSRLALP